MSVPSPVPGRPVPGDPPGTGVPSGGPDAPFDPLRLCIFATVALLAWLFGPFAVLAFALLGFAGYVRARRAGLLRSRCYLRDTRLVLAYLAVLAVVAAAASAARVLDVLP